MSDSQLQQEKLAELLERLLNKGHRTLKDEYGTPHHGIETGLDEAFVIDRETRDALLKADPRSEEVIKPYLTEKAVSNWFAQEPDAWLIHLPKGAANIDDFPAIKVHLIPYQEQLEQRDTAKKWYELLRCYSGNEEAAGKDKMLLHHSEGSPVFAHELNGGYASGIGWLPFQDYFLLGTLNSKLYRLMLKKMLEEDKNAQTLKPEHFQRLPFPMPLVDNKGSIGHLSELSQKLVTNRDDLREHVSKEIAKNLSEGATLDDLSEKLLNWHFLNAYAISEEAERLFGKPIPEEMIPNWDNFMMDAKEQLNNMNQDLDQVADTIDLHVYEIFELNKDEIELLKSL